MGTTLQETPSGNRLHIGIFGKTNSGKSAFINAFSGQSVSIVADVKGTTTLVKHNPGDTPSMSSVHSDDNN